MRIEDLKDPRDITFCERAQHSGKNNVISVWDTPDKRFPLEGAMRLSTEGVDEFKNLRSAAVPKRSNLKQYESKSHPAKEAFDNAMDNEFNSGQKSSMARTVQNFLEEARAKGTLVNHHGKR